MAAIEAGLDRFSSWLDELSPYHRALRTPVYLEDDAPPLVRAFWERVGFSEAIGPAIAVRGSRPERAFAEREALKVIRGWCSSPDFRDRWGVSAPGDVDAAVRARLPARSRFVLVAPSVVTFTDETTGADDPPVLRLDDAGQIEPSWPSYVEMLVWQTCAKLAENRGAKPRDAPVPASPGLERPFAPALEGLWTLADGVWALGPPAARGRRDAWEQVLYRSPEDYFHHVRSRPDAELARYRVDVTGMARLIVEAAPALDPEHLATPGLRRFELPGQGSAPAAHWGLVELEGVRLWLEKWRTATSITVYAEPGQLPALKALLARVGSRVLEEAKPRVNRFARAPTAAEEAAARKLHDRARAAAEGRKR